MTTRSVATLFLAAGFALGTGCSTTRSGREVRKETSDKRKAPVIFSAKEGYQLFNLRTNNFFEYIGPGRSDLYAGTYERKGDSLFLGFHNNHRPADLTGSAFVDQNRRQLVLLSRDSSRHRRMTIIIGN